MFKNLWEAINSGKAGGDLFGVVGGVLIFFIVLFLIPMNKENQELKQKKYFEKLSANEKKDHSRQVEKNKTIGSIGAVLIIVGIFIYVVYFREK